MNHAAAYTFAALRGFQSGRTYYTITLPFPLVPRLLSVEDPGQSPDQRVQRALNRSRVVPIAQYILDNPETWVLPALLVSANTAVDYKPSAACRDIGELTIPMDARLLINDGQHRWAGIAEALRRNAMRKLKDQRDLDIASVTVLVFVDAGLKRSQQLFVDINFNGAKPASSLGVLFNHRDQASELARRLATTNPTFLGLVEMERSSIGKTSDKLFTIGAISTATARLLGLGRKAVPSPDQAKRASDFWAAVGQVIPGWNKVRSGTMSAAEVRHDYVHGHAVLLEALGEVGAALPERVGLNEQLANLDTIDWSRSNPAWEGKCMVGGVMQKNSACVAATAEYLLEVMGVSRG